MSYDDHEPGLDPEPVSAGEQRELDQLRDELNRRPANDFPAYHHHDTVAGPWNDISMGDN